MIFQIHKRTLRDTVEALTLFVVAFAAAHYFDLFEVLYETTRAHEDWELDEFILLVLVMPLPLAWFAYRKANELSKEMENSLKLEQALAHSDKMKSLGVLAGGVAHEINNQLLPILSMAELARDSMEPSSKDHRKMEIILKSAQNAQHTVSKILLFSRNDERSKDSCDLVSTWNTLESVLRTICPANITLNISLNGAGGVIHMSDDDFQSIIVNLFSNAIDAIADELGTVLIQASVEKPENDGDLLTPKSCCTLKLKVADTGPGIDQEDRKRIFDPFFTTKAPGKGVGLGLSIIYSFIQEAGGAIVLDSEVKSGCQFNISIPLYEGLGAQVE